MMNQGSPHTNRDEDDFRRRWGGGVPGMIRERSETVREPVEPARQATGVTVSDNNHHPSASANVA